MNLKSVTLYAIISSRTDIPMEEAARAAVKGGAGILQLREKDVSQEELLEAAGILLAVTRELGVPLIINDSIEAAAEAGADGVHLGQSDGSPEEARKILGSSAIIGVTARTPEQAIRAEKMGADYLGSGAVFPTSTKGNAVPMSRQTLSEISAAVSIPVFAVGGITPANVSSLAGTGIQGAAAVSGVFGYSSAEEIEAAARAISGTAFR